MEEMGVAREGTCGTHEFEENDPLEDNVRALLELKIGENKPKEDKTDLTGQPNVFQTIYMSKIGPIEPSSENLRLTG